MEIINLRADWNKVLSNEGGLSGRVNQAVFKSVVELSEVGGSILEVGPGRGDTAVALASLDRNVWVADMFSEPLKATLALANRQQVNIGLVQTDGENLSVKDGAFNLVYSQGLVEHFPNPKKILNEMTRVLSPGGFLLVDVPNMLSLQHLIKTQLVKSGKWQFGWETSFTVKALSNLLAEQGLQVLNERTYYWGMAMPIPQNLKPGLASMENRAKVKSTIIKIINYARKINTTRITSPAGFFLNNIGVIARKPS